MKRPTPKTMAALSKALDKAGLDVSLETDNDGQIILYTGLIEDRKTGKLREMTDKDLS